MSSYDILYAEIQNDPLALGYAAMTDQQRYDSLTDDTARPAPDRNTINSQVLFENINRTEWTTVTPDAAWQARLDRMLGLGDILVGPGTNGRTELLDLFDNTNWPTSRADLIAYVQNQTQSRAQELGAIVTEGVLQNIRSNMGV